MNIKLLALLISFLSIAFAYAHYKDGAPTHEHANSHCTNLTSNVNNKSYRDNIFKFQNFLYLEGYLEVEPTGYYGPRTIRAVKDFQFDHNLDQTGYAGPRTRYMILEMTCDPSIVKASPLIIYAPKTSYIWNSTSSAITTITEDNSTSTIK